jgi:4-amino-4-deoxy-L-arabinose transferase-like glycosyltransferase
MTLQVADVAPPVAPSSHEEQLPAWPREKARPWTRSGLIARPWLAPVLSSLLAAVLTTWNAFGYPRLRDDEGQIVGQAWGILHGESRAALYGLLHLPGAPGLLAGWSRFLGLLGVDNLTQVQQGRVLLVLFAAIEAPLLYLIVRRFTGRSLLAFGAVVLLVLSPLELWYARWVETDPFAAFWTVLALFLAMPPAKDRARSFPRVLLAGLCLGIAMFSKEVAVVTVPGFVVLCFAWPKGKRLLATGLFAAGATVVPGGFLAWVAAHGELLPSSSHPSLLTKLLSETGRNHSGSILNGSSQFWVVQGIWSDLQPFFLPLTAVAALWLAGFASSRARRALGVMALGYWVLFGSGVIVQDYYVASALPIWVAAAVVGTWDFLQRDFVQKRISDLGQRARTRGGIALAALLLLGPAIPADAQAYFGADATTQAQLTVAARQLVPADAAFVDDGYDTVDMQASTSLPGHRVPLSCNYFDRWCLRSPHLTTAFIVDDGFLRYLAQGDQSYAGIMGLIKHGELVWSAHDVNGGDLLLYRVRLTEASAR